MNLEWVMTNAYVIMSGNTGVDFRRRVQASHREAGAQPLPRERLATCIQRWIFC